MFLLFFPQTIFLYLTTSLIGLTSSQPTEGDSFFVEDNLLDVPESGPKPNFNYLEKLEETNKILEFGVEVEEEPKASGLSEKCKEDLKAARTGLKSCMAKGKLQIYLIIDWAKRFL